MSCNGPGAWDGDGLLQKKTDQHTNYFPLSPIQLMSLLVYLTGGDAKRK